MQYRMAKALRKRMTEAENRLWYYIRDRRLDGVKYRRQHPIGSHVVDFVCLTRKLVIEVDGGQHSETADKERTVAIEAEGFKVIRFWNNDVLGNTDAVIETIRAELAKRPQKFRRKPKKTVPSPQDWGEG